MSGAESTSSLKPGEVKVVRGISGILPSRHFIHGEIIPEQGPEDVHTLEIKVETETNGREVSITVPNVLAEEPFVEIVDAYREMNNEAPLALGGIRAGLDYIAEVYHIDNARVNGHSNINRGELPASFPGLQDLDIAA
jgi:hypothetical protein